jgi:hypothetical protein
MFLGNFEPIKEGLLWTWCGYTGKQQFRTAVMDLVWIHRKAAI